MSVIGRLDGQVDAILISPLKRKDETETTTTPSELAETTAEQLRRPEAHDVAAARRTAKPDLPVWLL